MKKLIIFLMLFGCFFAGCGITKPVLDAGTLTTILQSKKFIFKAQSALPQGEKTIQLSPGYYDLRLNGDTLISYLPYYGKAYSMPGPGSVLDFKSTDFNYEFESTKSGWNVSIKPNDVYEIESINIMITTTGNASLLASFKNRQSISFNGSILEK